MMCNDASNCKAPDQSTYYVFETNMRNHQSKMKDTQYSDTNVHVFLLLFHRVLKECKLRVQSSKLIT